MAAWKRLPTPTWVEELVDDMVVANDLLVPPTIEWWERTGNRTHGQCGLDKIDVGVVRPSDGFEKYVLLHEIAHYLTPGREAHGFNFWRKCFDLLEKYADDDGLPAYVKDEFGYRAGAADEAALRPRWRQLAREWVADKAIKRQAARIPTGMKPAEFRLDPGMRVRFGPRFNSTWRGKLATIVSLRRTRAEVRLEQPVNGYPTGHVVLARMNALVPDTSSVDPVYKPDPKAVAKTQLAAAAIAAELGGPQTIDAATLARWAKELS